MCHPLEAVCNTLLLCVLKPFLTCDLKPFLICVFQLMRIGRRTGRSTQVAMPRGLCHPATVFMGYHRSAVLAAGGLGPQQKPLQLTGDSLAPDLPSCSPAPGSLDPESRSTDSVNDALVEGAVRCGDLAESEEVSEQLISSASNPKPATHEEEQPQGRFPGTVIPLSYCLLLLHTGACSCQSEAHGC